MKDLEGPVAIILRYGVLACALLFAAGIAAPRGMQEGLFACGTGLLIFVPAARVAWLAVVFLLRRELLFGALSLVVLMMLVCGVFAGHGIG